MLVCGTLGFGAGLSGGVRVRGERCHEGMEDIAVKSDDGRPRGELIGEGDLES
jgi:hypothetical protein